MICRGRAERPRGASGGKEVYGLAGKRYFWLKLPEDFFRRGYIRRLRSMENGDRLALIYLEMLLAGLKTEGLIACDGAEDPAEELALELFESPEEVSRVLEYCTRRGKAAWEDERRFRMTDCAEMTGAETADALRMRELRRREREAGIFGISDRERSAK